MQDQHQQIQQQLMAAANAIMEQFTAATIAAARIQQTRVADCSTRATTGCRQRTVREVQNGSPPRMSTASGRNGFQAVGPTLHILEGPVAKTETAVEPDAGRMSPIPRKSTGFQSL